MKLYNTKKPSDQIRGSTQYLYIDNYEHNRIPTTLLERLDELDMLIIVFIISLYIKFVFFVLAGRWGSNPRPRI